MAHNFHEDTEIFAAVIDKKGFSHAAEFLGISPALVSRRIRALEMQLGVTLLTRSTRKFELTPEGKLLYQHAKKVMLDKQTTLLAIETLSSQPTGLLKVSAPLNFGRQYVSSALCEFMKIYPEIEIDLLLSNSQSDLINEKFDLVIRGAGYLNSQTLADNNLIAKKLITSSIILCASPDFIQRHKTISYINDLEGLMGLDFMPTIGDAHRSDILWDGQVEKQAVQIQLKKQFTCNDIDTTIKMACEGNGIAKLAEISVREELKTNTLVQILPEVDFGDYHLYVVFPHRTLPQRTRVLLEFFEQRWDYTHR